MDYLYDLDACLRRDDGFQIATTLFELAQALSDLGLHEYALNTSEFALDTLSGPYVVMQNHPSSCHFSPVPTAWVLKPPPAFDLAYTSLNDAVLLGSIGLEHESATVAFEPLEEVEQPQPDTKISSAL